MIPLQQSPSLLSRALALLLPLVLVATLSVVLAVPVTVVPPAPPFPALVQGLLTRVQASVVEVLVCPAADQDPECSSPVSFSSGVLFSADGEVLTASGAVTPATRLVVATLDGQRHPAVLVGFDEALGLALLRASVVGAVHVSPATELPAVGAAVLTLGFSDLDELTPRSGTLRAAFAVSSHPALSSRELS